jgi:hypothetical protein
LNNTWHKGMAAKVDLVDKVMGIAAIGTPIEPRIK